MREIKIAIKIWHENDALTSWQVDFDGETVSVHFEGLTVVIDSGAGTFRPLFIVELVQNAL